jgi:hypothetical protein
MEQARTEMRTRSISGLSLLVALITFLMMWGGVVLLLTDPHGPQVPPQTSSPRGMMVSLLLFWLPVCTGGVACLSGLVGLAGAREQLTDARRRAVVGILLGLAPICLSSVWLGLSLASSR